MQTPLLFISALFSAIIIPVIHIHIIIFMGLTKKYLEFIVNILLFIIQIFIIVKFLEIL